MQPYFFPYPGYFSLIKLTDFYVVFDTPQYGSRTFMNRNRILDPNSEGWTYITVPVKKHHLKTAINQIEICDEINWMEKIVSQFSHYRKRAPYYNQVIAFLMDTLNVKFKRLSDLNLHTIKAICAYIGIDFKYDIFSEMDLQIEAVTTSDEWGLNICKAMSFPEFIYPERGQLFVDREKYTNSNIKLQFLKYCFPEYNQYKNKFVSGLSILDAMMYNTASEINEMLDEYQLVS